MAPELPVLEIAYVDVTIGNATLIPLIGHYAFLFLYSARRAAMRTLEDHSVERAGARHVHLDRFGNVAAKRAPGAGVIFGQHPELIFACRNLARELPDS